MQSGIDDAALGLRVRRDLVQALTQSGLDLVRPLFERVQRVVALALEPGAQSREPLLHPLGCSVADVVDAFGEHALGLAREALDREVELPAQPPRSLLARAFGSPCRTVRRPLRCSASSPA